MTGWGREQISFKIELNISAKACLIILTYWNMDVPSNPKGRQKGYFHKPTILGSEFCYSYYSLLQKGLCRNEAIPIRFLAIALIQEKPKSSCQTQEVTVDVATSNLHTKLKQTLKKRMLQVAGERAKEARSYLQKEMTKKRREYTYLFNSSKRLEFNKIQSFVLPIITLSQLQPSNAKILLYRTKL